MGCLAIREDHAITPGAGNAASEYSADLEILYPLGEVDSSFRCLFIWILDYVILSIGVLGVVALVRGVVSDRSAFDFQNEQSAIRV
jgi:hypothetical protein